MIELPRVRAELTHLVALEQPTQRLMSLVLRVAVEVDQVEQEARLERVERGCFGFLDATWKTADGVLFGLRCYVEGPHSVVSVLAGVRGPADLARATVYRDRLQALTSQMIEASGDYRATWS